jgi:hypothetical protein
VDTTSLPPPETPLRPPGWGFLIGWTVFRLVVWSLILTWLHPRTLDWVGGHDVAVWLQQHLWFRLLTSPVLLVLGILSAFQVTNGPDRRRKSEALAGALGATVTESKGVDLTLGISDQPGLRVPLGAWSTDVAVWKKNSATHTVARLRVMAPSDFSFVARGTGREPAMLRGLQERAVRFALGDMTGRTATPQAAAAARSIDYLAGPPIQTGRETLDRTVVLRSNRPDAARAMLASGPVASAVMALDARTRHWDWTFYPEAEGIAEMTLTCRGTLDAESIALVGSLMKEALEHLEQQGLVTGRAA